jgi:uncharacterized iron-regulated protein
MAFKLDDIIIDRIQYGLAEDFDGNPLYTLTQLADATIDVTAESKDAVDSTGTLIKRFYQGKSGEFTANNAMLNLNILGAASGEGKVSANDFLHSVNSKSKKSLFIFFRGQLVD